MYAIRSYYAFEGLYNGSEGAGLIAMGIMSSTDTDERNENLMDFNVKLEIPNILSYMAYMDWNAFVPGINDLIEGNEKYSIMSAHEKIERGKAAILKLKEYKDAKKAGNAELAESIKADRITSYNVCYTKLLRTILYRRPQTAPSIRTSFP